MCVGGGGVTLLAAFEVKELATTVRSPCHTMMAPPDCKPQQVSATAPGGTVQPQLRAKGVWTHVDRVAFEGTADHR